MATNGGVSFRKIDSSKLSFFDLPGEVRELVYQEHFFSLGDFSIHLTNIAPDKPARAEPPGPSEPTVPSCGLNRRAVISTMYGSRLHTQKQRLEEHQAWRENATTIEELTTTLAQLEIEEWTYRNTVEDLIADTPPTNIMWTNLEAAAKILKTEASSYGYCENLFRVVGSHRGEGDSFGVPYHSDLHVVPQQLLCRIKNLKMDHSMWGSFGKVATETWTTGTWPILLTKLVNLQNLWLTGAHAAALCDGLNLFTMTKAYYVGPRPIIRVEVELEVDIVDDKFGQHKDPYKCVKVSPYAPRFLIPPLETITLSGWLCRFDECGGRLDNVDWNGGRLKQVKAYKTFPESIFGTRIYELAWS